MNLLLLFLGLCFFIGVGIAIIKITFTITIELCNSFLVWIDIGLTKLWEFIKSLRIIYYRLVRLPKLRRIMRKDDSDSNRALAERLLHTKHKRSWK